MRFFFRYQDLIKHPDAVYDGVLPLKVKNEVVLKDWIHAVIVPEGCRNITEPVVPENLANKVFYVGNDCADIWEWSERVYEFAKALPDKAWR